MSTIFAKIPDNLRKATVSERTGNILVLGRLMYASFYTTVPPSRRETNPKKFQWGSTLLIPGLVDLTVLEQQIKETASANLTAAQQKANTAWKNPLLKTADGGALAGYAEDYPIFIRPNAKEFEKKSGKRRSAPEVIDARGAPIGADKEADETYNGRWARLSVQPYWYPGEDGKPGVSLGLVNAQLLWHDDPLSGGKAKASSDFEPVDADDLAGLDEEFA